MVDYFICYLISENKYTDSIFDKKIQGSYHDFHKNIIKINQKYESDHKSHLLYFSNTNSTTGLHMPICGAYVEMVSYQIKDDSSIFVYSKRSKGKLLYELNSNNVNNELLLNIIELIK